MILYCVCCTFVWTVDFCHEISSVTMAGPGSANFGIFTHVHKGSLYQLSAKSSTSLTTFSRSNVGNSLFLQLLLTG